MVDPRFLVSVSGRSRILGRFRHRISDSPDGSSSGSQALGHFRSQITRGRPIPPPDPRSLLGFGARSRSPRRFQHQIPDPRSASVPDLGSPGSASAPDPRPRSQRPILDPVPPGAGELRRRRRPAPCPGTVPLPAPGGVTVTGRRSPPPSHTLPPVEPCAGCAPTVGAGCAPMVGAGCVPPVVL